MTNVTNEHTSSGMCGHAGLDAAEVSSIQHLKDGAERIQKNLETNVTIVRRILREKQHLARGKLRTSSSPIHVTKLAPVAGKRRRLPRQTSNLHKFHMAITSSRCRQAFLAHNQGRFKHRDHARIYAMANSSIKSLKHMAIDTVEKTKLLVYMKSLCEGRQLQHDHKTHNEGSPARSVPKCNDPSPHPQNWGLAACTAPQLSYATAC